MKKLLLALVVLSLSLTSAAFACDDEEASTGGAPQIQAVNHPGAHSAQLKVKGMMCSSCAKKVDATLRKMPGVTGVSMDTRKGIAIVSYNEGSTPAEMVAAVSNAGFKAALARK